MNKAIIETKEFLSKLPQTNSVSTYGSGFFKQEDTAGERKTRDLIISVDNPNFWHRQNYKQNEEMYKGTLKHNLMNNGTGGLITFPRSFGCFFTTYKDNEYKLLVVDKHLLYNNLKTWAHMSFPGRFQKEMFVISDNSKGYLSNLMKLNYENAIRVAILTHPNKHLNKEDLYKAIASLSYKGDIRTIKFEDPNKVNNIVEGSYDFFEKTYGNNREYQILNNIDFELLDIIEELPDSLKHYLLKELSYDNFENINNKEIVAQIIEEYITKRNIIDSTLMMLRCNETVGPEKVSQTVAGKIKKGMQKIKK